MFLRSIVEWIVSLESGENFRKMSSLWLRICGVLSLLLSISLGIGLLIAVPKLISGYGISEANTFFMIGLTICAALIFSVGIILFMLLQHRANKINSIGEESHLIFGPIASIYIRLAGEICFLLLSGLTSVLFLFTIFVIGFDWGIALICFLLSIFFLLLGYFTLKFLYIIAEYAGLVGDIATNARKIETTLATTVAATTAPESVPSEEVS